MNKKLVTTFALAATLLVGSVASAANWNGLANYPEVPNSANGTETYYFDKASQFNLIDGSRNYVFGINVVNMHNFAPDGQLYQINPGTNEFNMFKAAWKEVYGTDFAFPDVNAVPATVNVHA